MTFDPKPSISSGVDMTNLATVTASKDRKGFVFAKRATPKPTVVFDTYWRFAVERQEIYFRRLDGLRGPWTADPILDLHRFTNTYRAADRVSQYLIKNVAYAEGRFSERDQALRILLFKIFNKIETWELLEREVGTISCSNLRIAQMDAVLEKARACGASIYSAAYIMPSGSGSLRLPRKHLMHLNLLKSMIQDGVLEAILEARTMEAAFHILLGLPSFGPFLAYQFVTDLNYSSILNFSEMEFVVPGPGAKDGIRKCFSNLGDLTEAEAIRWVADRQHEEFAARGLKFKSLWGRPLQLIDCQNIFCEVDKYARVAHPDALGRSGRTRIKQKFSPIGALPQPWFPPKWNLNVPGIAGPRPVLELCA